MLNVSLSTAATHELQIFVLRMKRHVEFSGHFVSSSQFVCVCHSTHEHGGIGDFQKYKQAIDEWDAKIASLLGRRQSAGETQQKQERRSHDRDQKEWSGVNPEIVLQEKNESTKGRGPCMHSKLFLSIVLISSRKQNAPFTAPDDERYRS